LDNYKLPLDCVKYSERISRLVDTQKEWEIHCHVPCKHCTYCSSADFQEWSGLFLQ